MPIDPNAPITITAYDWVPWFARGHVRDYRVRWALEEVGRSYAVRLLSQGAQKKPDHRAVQPFGQVPTYEEGGLTLFESGAIVLHIAQQNDGLLPSDPGERMLVIEWMFAALNTVEPPISDHAIATLFEADKPWSEPRLPSIKERIDERITELEDKLGDRDWLVGDTFTAADLIMVSVIRGLAETDMLDSHPVLAAYIERGTARPAFKAAQEGQMAGFTGKPPKGYEFLDQPLAKQEQPA